MSFAIRRVIVYTSRIEAMVDFYTHHFGFKVSRSDGDRIVELRSEVGGLALLLHPASSAQKEGQVTFKLVFDVENVEAFCIAAKMNGLEFGKVHKTNGYAFANAKDPAKNSIQISSRAFAFP